jgi:hypothetical protein
MASYHPHPAPALDALTQYGAVAILLLIGLLLASQVGLALGGAPPFLLLITSLTLALLTLPTLMQVTAAPAVIVDDEGLTLVPRLLRPRPVAWHAITAIKPNPLLPSPDTEGLRQALIGRSQYRAAEGILLIVPSLPWMYRCTGFFAGEGFTGVIALTNRTHRDYAALAAAVRAHVMEQAA